MAGFDPFFLGADFKVDLPTFSPTIQPDVLTAQQRPDTDFQNEAYVRYIHYSVATNTARRQPIVVALNIDQKLIKSAKRSGWDTDPRVGEFQLDNAYYRRNPYDRGHLARRSTAAWGVTAEDAKAASDATMFYTNAALQHENFNQDEWLELEDFVKNLQEDLTDKISVFSGPIYTSSINETKFIGNPPAAIPTSFFKVVAFVDKQGKFATRAFIMAQDKFALSDKNAKNRRFDLGAYQVPVKLIEEETGLVFDQKLRETNPLIFTEPEPVAEPVKLAPRETFPQIIPVGPDTVQPDMGPAPTIASDTKMAIICAMINAEGDETKNEWVTLFNFGRSEMDLTNWSLSDGKRPPLALQTSIRPGEGKRIDYLYDESNNVGVRLSNKSGRIELLTPDNAIADRVTYSKQSHMIREGLPVKFNLDEHVVGPSFRSEL